MKGFKPSKNKGMSGARKRQKAAGDHSVKRVKQSKAAMPKESSMGFSGNKIDSMERKSRDNIGGSIKAPREGCGD